MICTSLDVHRRTILPEIDTGVPTALSQRLPQPQQTGSNAYLFAEAWTMMKDSPVLDDIGHQNGAKQMPEYVSLRERREQTVHCGLFGATFKATMVVE
jgi:hypothetical protein